MSANSAVQAKQATTSPPGPTLDGTSRGFWLFAALLGLFPVAASAPSPLYADYAARWHFSDSILTLVFAVYALPLLIALLALGSLSDQIGRKPVALAACAMLSVSLILFVLADGLTALIAARALQGFATGLLTAVASAALLDLQSPRRPGLASLLGATLSTGGLGVGALLSGLLVQYAWNPSKLVYLVILTTLIALAVATATRAIEPVSDRVAPHIRIRIAVPREARAAFLATIPCLISTWALVSFYLSLGPTLAGTLTHSNNHLPGAGSVALLTGLASLAALFARNWASKTSMLTGCAVLGAGSLLTTAAVAATSAPTYFVSTAIAGVGFGMAFSGAFRSLVALAHPDERGALVAATYVVGYTTFAVPAIAAGIISTHDGLHRTALGYSAAVAALALIAIITTNKAVRPVTLANSA
jgi:MFS family permease